MLLVFGLIFLIPGTSYSSDSNSNGSGKGSADGSSKGDSGKGSLNGSGDESGKALLIGIVGAAVIIGAGIWGGITTSRSLQKKKMKRRKRKIATAIFSEATKGYGDKTNITIMAKYYCCSVEKVIDTISALSMKGDIDVNGSLVDEQIATESLDKLETVLLSKARKNSKFKKNLKTIINNLANQPDLIKNIAEPYNLNLMETANFYRSLFNGN